MRKYVKSETEVKVRWQIHESVSEYEEEQLKIGDGDLGIINTANFIYIYLMQRVDNIGIPKAFAGPGGIFFLKWQNKVSSLTLVLLPEEPIQFHYRNKPRINQFCDIVKLKNDLSIIPARVVNTLNDMFA